MAQTEQQILGHWGEDQAIQFLERHGYTIVTRNFTTDYGEIDIIARINETLSFIEVKTRRGWTGSAERAVGGNKISRMAAVARQYCRQQNINMDQQSIRFEQLSMYYHNKSHKLTIIRYILPL